MYTNNSSKYHQAPTKKALKWSKYYLRPFSNYDTPQLNSRSPTIQTHLNRTKHITNFIKA